MLKRRRWALQAAEDEANSLSASIPGLEEQAKVFAENLKAEEQVRQTGLQPYPTASASHVC
jgi:hypothetical protein